MKQLISWVGCKQPFFETSFVAGASFVLNTWNRGANYYRSHYWLLIICLLYACQTTSVRNEENDFKLNKPAFYVEYFKVIENQYKTFQKNEIGFQLDTICLRKDEYEICVYSQFTRDSIGQNESYGLTPIVIDQTVELSYKNKSIYKKAHNVPKRLVETWNLGAVKALENAIVEVGIINGARQKFFVIRGFGGCSFCSNYTHIIDTSAHTIMLLYEAEDTTYISQGLFPKDMIIESGIDNDSFCTSKYLHKRLQH